MRINLNFKDALIKRMNESEFKIEFDLSKMIKPRLSNDARMYIEHFNLPEFIDEKFGRDKGDLRGYFELRTDNIDSNDFDSEYGNTGNTIIYTSPLNNFGTFTNNDPMYISNFKISQNFLRDKLVFILKFFDRNGDPFTTSVTTSEEIVHDVHLAFYKTNVNQLTTLQTELEDANTTLNLLEQRLQTQKSSEAVALNVFYQKRDKLFQKINEIFNNKTYKVNTRLKLSTLEILLQNEAINAFTYLFEEFIPSRITESPYNIIQYELDEFYEEWVIYVDASLKVENAELKINEIKSTNTNIWYNTQSEYNPDNINVKSELLNNIDYTTQTGKTGTIDFKTFNSVLNTTTNISVGDITPDSTSGNELVVGDVIVIDKSKFTSVVSEKFEYYFVKTTTKLPTGVTINNNSNDSRFSLKVVRDGSTYTYEFLNDVDAKGVVIGTEITIDGSVLGGIVSTNDLVIEIDAVYVPALSQVYTFTNLYDENHTDNGTMNISIERDNSALVYSEDSSDFTNTKNYNVGDIITIDGPKVDGDTKTNDVKIEVKDVILPEMRYSLDDSNITHSIKPVIINEDNSSVTDSGGTLKATAKDYQFEVFSEDGTYKLSFDNTNDGSTGFDVGDLIKIEGSVLSGEDVTNNLVVEVLTVSAGGKIQSIRVEAGGTYNAKNASTFEFDIIVKVNETNYEIEFKSGVEFKVGDVLRILGDELGGATGTNDLVFSIDALISDKNAVQSMKIISGIALPETGTVGQIKSVDISGTAKEDKNDGRFITSQTSLQSGTPINIATLVLPDLKITLLSQQDKGIARIEQEILDKYVDIKNAKNTLNSVKEYYHLDLNTMPDKIKCFNCSLVLYDEIPEYSQASKDAISGNTYSRINGCQFKRI